MRVVMVSKALVVGAYQRKAEEIVRHGAELDLELTVLVPTSWRDKRGEQQAEKVYTKGYTFKPIPICFNGQFHIHFYPTLLRQVKRYRPDILHMDEEPYNLATWQGLRIADRLGVPSLFFTWQNLTRRYPPPFRWIEKTNYQRATMAIAGNQSARSVLHTKGFGKPIEVLPQFGVDTEHFRPAADQEDGLPGDAPLRIGYAGGLLPEKGITELIEACAAMKRPWRLQIVGEGSQRNELLRLAEELNVVQNLSIMQRLPSDEMPTFYQQLDVLVLPSRTQTNWMEQFGRVLIEAMACGVTVVGSSSGEIPNVIGEAGLVYPEGDVAALTVTLQELAENEPMRSRLAVAGRQRVLENYTMEHIAQKTVELYKEMCS